MGRSRRDKIRGLPRNFYVSCAIYICIGGGLGAALGANVQQSRVAEGVSETQTLVIEVTPTPVPVAVIPQASGPFPTLVPTPRPTARPTLTVPVPAPSREAAASPFVIARGRG